MVEIEKECIEQYLEPLVSALLSLGQKKLVEQYVDLLGVVKEDEAYKHFLFFWSYAIETDVDKFNMCHAHLNALQNLSIDHVYDTERCKQFYEWRKGSV